MASTSAPEKLPQVHQQPAAPPSGTHNNSKIPLEDISKLFHLPIAEAATILGVCSSSLKRICREHGIVRWPYRKFIAGKTGEDMKRSTAGEGDNGLVDAPNIAKERIDGPKFFPLVSIGPSSIPGGKIPNRTSPMAQDAFKLQRGGSVVGHNPQQQVNKFSQDGWANSLQVSTRSVPTYLDDFKFGFPVHGLSSAINRWWGSDGKKNNERNTKEEPSAEKEVKNESCILSNKTSTYAMLNDQQDNIVEEPEIEIQPSALLCSARKTTAEYGRKTVKLGISRGFEVHKLSKRERSVLLQVFKASLPDQWKESFS